jgi:hypothetical protein
MKCVKANKVDLKNAAISFSFEQQNNHQSKDINHKITQLFHLHENRLIDVKNAAETSIQIIAAKSPSQTLRFAAIYMKKESVKTLLIFIALKLILRSKAMMNFLPPWGLKITPEAMN